MQVSNIKQVGQQQNNVNFVPLHQCPSQGHEELTLVVAFILLI